MKYAILCLGVFLSAYLLNVFYITVLYHRGLTHGAVRLKPWVRRLVVWSGNWVTGLDPKGWSCMHRLHHVYADTPLDPHSPVQLGVFGVFLGQLHSYKRALHHLMKKMEPHTSAVRDLDFSVNWLNRKKLWFLPYVLHAAIGVAIGAFFHAWLLGGAYWLGIMSHPLQGWMVNSLAHRFGYRNFNTPDNSKNNLIVSWLVMGEGYQNNHHHRPSAAKFSARWWEFDSGYILCWIGHQLRMVEISR